jgi:hypothetical protein
MGRSIFVVLVVASCGGRIAAGSAEGRFDASIDDVDVLDAGVDARRDADADAEAPMTYLAAGRLHTCAATVESVLCWGFNASGQLGDGTTESRSKPVEILRGAYRVAAGATHTCAWSDKEVLCWGAGQTKPAPVKLPGVEEMALVSAA